MEVFFFFFNVMVVKLLMLLIQKHELMTFITGKKLTLTLSRYVFLEANFVGCSPHLKRVCTYTF